MSRKTTPDNTLVSRPAVLLAYLRTEVAGAAFLLIAALVAVVFVNVGGNHVYEDLWHYPLPLDVGGITLDYDLHDWVNEGLMTLFFLVVGLEIKREIVDGELSEPRVAALPIVAALGGMVVPGLLYFAFNTGGDASRGWAIPMATDIAFALGVLHLLGSRVPTELKVFLLTLAIVDDIGAIAVIAVFYTENLNLGSLGWAGTAAIGIVALARLRVGWAIPYILAGLAMWFAMANSGIHPTIAGVVLGLALPLREAKGSTKVSLGDRFESALHPVSTYIVMPLFAFANAGIVFASDAFEAEGTIGVAVGIGVGLVVGKTVGISLASWLAVRAGWARLPSSVTPRHILGAAAIAGMGFTVSLFIVSLAFAEGPFETAAKVGVFIGSLLAALIGAAILLFTPSAGAKAREPR